MLYLLAPCYLDVCACDRCSYRGKMCHSTDFQMTILTEHGVCYTLEEQYVEENKKVGTPDAGEMRCL